MSKLDTKLLKLVKQGFVPQPGGQAEPVAGAGPMTAGMVAPMSDPSMGGMPMDPSMGGMPMDPSMMPPAGLDPAMAGLLGGAMPPPEGGAGGAGRPGTMINMTSEEFLKFLKQIMAIMSNGPAQAQPQAPDNTINAKLDELIGLMKGALGG